MVALGSIGALLTIGLCSPLLSDKTILALWCLGFAFERHMFYNNRIKRRFLLGIGQIVPTVVHPDLQHILHALRVADSLISPTFSKFFRAEQKTRQSNVTLFGKM